MEVEHYHQLMASFFIYTEYCIGFSTFEIITFQPTRSICHHVSSKQWSVPSKWLLNFLFNKHAFDVNCFLITTIVNPVSKYVNKFQFKKGASFDTHVDIVFAIPGSYLVYPFMNLELFYVLYMPRLLLLLSCSTMTD